MRKSLLFTVFVMAGLLGTILSSGSAEARRVSRGTWEQYCAWSPKNRAVCTARRDCLVHPLHGQCATYCKVNPRDVACGEYYQPTLPRVYPNGQTPYWWGQQRGGFCQDQPYNIACQHNWPWGAY